MTNKNTYVVCRMVLAPSQHSFIERMYPMKVNVFLSVILYMYRKMMLLRLNLCKTSTIKKDSVAQSDYNMLY